jgi:hypothetical protein
MTSADLVLAALVVVWIISRQVRTAQVRPRVLVVVPLVLLWAGVRGLQADAAHLTDPVSLALLGATAAAALGLGAWRGVTLRVWRAPDGTWWRRGTALTLVLWLLVLAVRGGLAAAGYATGHPQTSGVSVLLCSLALSFAAQNAVTLLRTSAVLPAATAPQQPASRTAPAPTR